MTGEELRARREELGLTQQELAKRLTVAISTVSRWELGDLRIVKHGMLDLALKALAVEHRPAA